MVSKASKRIEEEVIDPARRLLSSQFTLLGLSGPTIFVGDLHGDLRTARSALDLHTQKGTSHLVFLGDVVDRGKESLPVLELLLKAMMADPAHVHILRGNHETLVPNTEYGFKAELERRGVGDLHLPFNELFSQMPVAAVLDGRVLAVHGGVPEEIPSLEEIGSIRKGVIEPDGSRDHMLLGLLWNDPDEDVQQFGENTYRGYMRVFGRKAFESFAEKNDIEMIVRGHQRWQQGFRWFFGTKVLSLFSCTSYSSNVSPKAALVKGPAVTMLDL